VLNSVPSRRNRSENCYKSILILDEEFQAGENLKQILEGSGYRIDLRRSISDFRIAELDLAGFDLVICDSENGLRLWNFLLDRIHSQKLLTQLVVISKKARGSEWFEALQLGVFDFLVTPYSTNEVLRIVSSAFLMNYSQKFQTA
jgi:DNA-binding NtrC family response regulator